MTRQAHITIIGGGLAGNLLAIHLARRGLHAVVVERSAPYSRGPSGRGRSINLALAARGIRALEGCGVLPRVRPLLIPMRGRMLHEQGGKPRFAAYGQREDEINFSVSRANLNKALYEIASKDYGVEYRFATSCVGIDPDTGMPLVDSGRGPRPFASRVVLCADGAGSAIRGALRDLGVATVAEELLDHGYKELTIPADARGEFALEPNALHIWPRGGYMLIALPNTDRSFTATLFLPLEGKPSFATIDARNIAELFAAEFTDALPVLGDVEREFAANPTGILGTVRCEPWTYEDRYLLIGDAAHAIVPFHGQGMNAAFEDIAALDELLELHGDDWATVMRAFELERRANANAIADMALENYVEMRDSVRDEGFQLRRELAFELERRFPQRFIPRYSMVMFHPEISYAEAQRRGALQRQILERLTATATRIDEIDFRLAERMVIDVPELSN